MSVESRYIIRPIPAGFEAPTRLLYPSQRHLIPSRCTHGDCGGRVLVTAAPVFPHGDGEAACLLCGRVARLLTAEPERQVAAASLAPRAYRSGGLPIWQRLVNRLADVGADDAAGLAYALGVTTESARVAVRDARRYGHAISMRNGLYSLLEGVL